MATSNASRTCLQRLATSQIPRSVSRRTHTIQSAQRYVHTPTPLYLDFLAPSWRANDAHVTRSVQPRNVAPIYSTPKRSISTTRPRLAKAITNPRKDDSGNEMNIIITPRAAHRLQAIAETDSNPDLVLRVSVESGGCHGFQYLMSLVSKSDVDPAEDTLFENEEVANKKSDGAGEFKAKVVMDEPSLELLKGSSIDYTMELIGSQFKVTGIPGATSSCGCGTSFDVAA